ncbi:MAG: efflux RND transporter periplasmic adaptor subunit [Bacteroidia bacterium]
MKRHHRSSAIIISQRLAALLLLGSACSCHTPAEEEGETTEARTPVTITNVSIEPIAESVELRATSQFQKKVAVKSNTNGYIDEVTVNIGDNVNLDQLLFTIRTKEATALLGQNVPDSMLHFSGLLKIKAQKNGIITTLEHQKGDYVQDGDELGIISERNSLVFILEVPFEMHSIVKLNDDCEIILPDGQSIKGLISGVLPSVDAVAQTQSYVVKPLGSMPLPENLIAKVHIVKRVKSDATVISKQALLADETQTEFWVMKLINDSIAIKVPVKKGIETSGKVEILEPRFSATDRIIFSGNYGLNDTAKITIEKNGQ